MSIATPFGSDRSATGSIAQTLHTVARRPVEAAAFWTAVLLPLAYPWLMFGGLDGRELFLLLGALALNAATLVLGRGHKRDRV